MCANVSGGKWGGLGGHVLFSHQSGGFLVRLVGGGWVGVVKNLVTQMKMLPPPHTHT